MKKTISVLLLFMLSLKFLLSQNFIAEVTEEYDDGETKTIEYYQNIPQFTTRWYETGAK